MRTVDEIYQELLTSFQERSGYEAKDSCDLAVRLYAVAAQLQAMEYQTEWVLNQCFPQTAQGASVDSHAEMRGITRKKATYAEGVLRFTVADAAGNDRSIPKGTVCMTEKEIRFQTTKPAILKTGNKIVDVPARAIESGSGSNAVAGSVNILAACPVGITGCTNPAAFTGGTDCESDESLRKRILTSYQRLPNGANAVFYEEQALRHEGVAAATAIGRARGIGTVDVCIATAAGTPDGNLLAEVAEDLQAKREIAVDVQVVAPTLNSVDVSVELMVQENFGFAEVKTAVESTIAKWFTGKLLGRPVLLAELGRLIFFCGGCKKLPHFEACKRHFREQQNVTYAGYTDGDKNGDMIWKHMRDI